MIFANGDRFDFGGGNNDRWEITTTVRRQEKPETLWLDRLDEYGDLPAVVMGPADLKEVTAEDLAHRIAAGEVHKL